MRIHAPLLLLPFLFAPAPAGGDEELDAVLATITAEDCFARVGILAGPGMNGRATPSRGLEEALAYVEKELAALGLEPAGAEGSYRVEYEMPCLLADETSQFRWIDGKGEEHPAAAGEGFTPVPGSSASGVRGEPIFVGYAIDAKNERWIDLSPKKVKGKVVFAFTREPRADDPKNKSFDGLEASRYSQIDMKTRAVEQAGGVGLVLIADPAGFPDATGPIPDLLPMGLGNRAPRDPGRYAQLPLPVASVSRAIAEEIFGEDLAAYQAAIDKRHKPKLLEVKNGVVVDFTVRWKVEDVKIPNLAARIPGSDGGGKAVVLGAHLDHVGLNFLFDRGRARVHPGADDNASGCATLLEVAQAFAGTKPVHEMLFLWFTGEELGLVGSQAYCAEPVHAHKDTIAMLNMDMVGRGDPKEMSVGGTWDDPAWRKFVDGQRKRIGSRIKIDFEGGRDLYPRSDQYSFYQKDVPALFFYEGDINSNKTYHTPQDLAETIDGEKMGSIGRLFAATAYALAFEGEQP
ncbi:MAG TPA: M28 family peptidase [Planctomycetota bacterium]